MDQYKQINQELVESNSELKAQIGAYQKELNKLQGDLMDQRRMYVELKIHVQNILGNHFRMLHSSLMEMNPSNNILELLDHGNGGMSRNSHSGNGCYSQRCSTSNSMRRSSRTFQELLQRCSDVQVSPTRRRSSGGLSSEAVAVIAAIEVAAPSDDISRYIENDNDKGLHSICEMNEGEEEGEEKEEEVELDGEKDGEEKEEEEEMEEEVEEPGRIVQMEVEIPQRVTRSEEVEEPEVDRELLLAEKHTGITQRRGKTAQKQLQFVQRKARAQRRQVETAKGDKTEHSDVESPEGIEQLEVKQPERIEQIESPQSQKHTEITERRRKTKQIRTQSSVQRKTKKTLSQVESVASDRIWQMGEESVQRIEQLELEEAEQIINIQSTQAEKNTGVTQRRRKAAQKQVQSVQSKIVSPTKRQVESAQNQTDPTQSQSLAAQNTANSTDSECTESLPSPPQHQTLRSKRRNILIFHTSPLQDITNHSVLKSPIPKEKSAAALVLTEELSSSSDSTLKSPQLIVYRKRGRKGTPHNDLSDIEPPRRSTRQTDKAMASPSITSVNSTHKELTPNKSVSSAMSELTIGNFVGATSSTPHSLSCPNDASDVTTQNASTRPTRKCAPTNLGEPNLINKLRNESNPKRRRKK